MKSFIKIRRREVIKNINLPSTIPTLLRRLYSSRGINNTNDLERGVRGLISWKKLSGIYNATAVLYNALCEDAKIVVVGDFDADGATSTALAVLCLRALGCNNVIYLVPNRFENGYGLSPELVDQAKKNGAKIIITVDNGISSHTGVSRASELGIQVIITDHHLPDGKLPAANAIVNPNLCNCNFPSKSLAGVGVAFYLMLALRALLLDKGWFKSRGIIMPNLAEYLDLVALGTIADIVPLDVNNRILTWQGLNRIKAGKCRPGIKALLEISNRYPLKIITANDLGFALGPRLNAAGRLDDMSIGVALLLCNSISEARILAKKLDLLNQARKEIEWKMQTEALALCEKLQHSDNNQLPSGLAMYHPNWHQGVIGVLASRIKDRFHRPVIAFAPAGNGTLKGSGRSVNGLHIREVIKYLNTLYPDLIIKFGGHAMAVGLSLKATNFNIFQYLFSKLVSDWIDPSLLHGEILSDGELTPEEMTVETAQLLRDAGPWGQMFPEPVFDGQFRLLQQRIIGRRHLKVMIRPINGGPLLDGISFNIDTASWPNNRAYKVELAYKLNINEFCSSRSLQLIIDHIRPI